jgi:hypothetical protein
VTIKTAILGQSPSERCWKQALVHQGGRVRVAEHECARIAITGKCGEALARLLGVHPLSLYVRNYRFNLNARWRGKQHGADVFDAEEGARTLRRILRDYPEIERVLCLGRHVGEVVGFSSRDPLLTKISYEGRSFLLFPHPSGLNRWWNDASNYELAIRALTEFLTPAADAS